MSMLKLLLILGLIVIGLIARPNSRKERTAPAPNTPAQVSTAKTPVNHEILQNAERLTETLRRCQQTAQKNRETK